MPEAVRRSMYVVQAEFDSFFAEAVENGWVGQIPCNDNPGPFVDWITPPSNAEAESLCAPCPIKKLCRELGDVTKPYYGVWGGKTWMQKRSIYGVGSPGIPDLEVDEISSKKAA